VSPAAEESSTKEQIARWIARLGSRKYVERRAAARALDQLGPRSFEGLDTAAKSTDAEVRRRARVVAQAIRKRIETDRLLAATRVRLSYRDTPLREAVADLAKKTGYGIQLGGDPVRWHGRKVTLDTGPTTFWRALDQFCAKAGLAEESLTLATRPPPAFSHIRFGLQPAAAKAKPRLVLVPYPNRPPAAAYWQGLRVRALPPSLQPTGVPKAAGDRILILEAAVEFRTPLSDLVGVRGLRVTDAQGKNVPALTHRLREHAEANSFLGRNGQPIPGYVRQLENGMQPGNFRRALVYVTAGKKLGTVSGTLLLEVEKPAGPVVTVKDIFRATGKTFDLPQGGSLTLGSVDRHKGGSITLHIETQFPLGGFIGGIRVMNGVVMVRRNMADTWDTIGLRTEQLKLLDAAGRPWRSAGAANTGVNFGPGINQTFAVTFAPAKGQTAATLVYYGVSTTVVEAPFILKDVPLE
jgi:hypothetical protein